jgi:hypothetical protein
VECGAVVARRGACRVLMGKHERRSLARIWQDGRIMLKTIFKKWDGAADWIELAIYKFVDYFLS